MFDPRNKKYVKFCPKCKSLNIRAELKSGWWIGLPAVYKCRNCGFKSRLFPEISMEEVKKKYVNAKHNKKR